MRIGSVDLPSPFAIAPMAGMTDSAFRRLVKRHGGCGLVVTEMVSSEGLVRGIDRTLEYAEYTEEERPISIQIFGGDPDKMAAAAQIVEGMGADIVDVNMGCPVPKIAKHNAGCSLMREPEQTVDKLRSGVDGVLVGRGVLRNPWILAQAEELAAGRPARDVTLDDRGRFLLDYIDMLKHERVDEARATSHDRWIVNKLRALASWYTKGLDNGSHLRTAINSAGSLDQLREIILSFFSP